MDRGNGMDAHCLIVHHNARMLQTDVFVVDGQTVDAAFGRRDPAGHPGRVDHALHQAFHAGARVRPVRALVAMAPHVFVEDLSIANIARARHDYENADLRARLSRYHLDVDSAFRGWNDIWLSPAFRDWNIESYLPGIDCPLLLIQGRDDEYGTLAQLDAIERQVRGRVDRVELLDCGHSPHRDQPQATLAAITGFVSTVS